MFRIEITTIQDNKEFCYTDDFVSAITCALKHVDAEDVDEVKVFQCEWDGHPRSDRGKLVWGKVR